jgi:hypothetical protein
MISKCLHIFKCPFRIPNFSAITYYALPKYELIVIHGPITLFSQYVKAKNEAIKALLNTRISTVFLGLNFVRSNKIR